MEVIKHGLRNFRNNKKLNKCKYHQKKKVKMFNLKKKHWKSNEKKNENQNWL